MRKFLQKRKRKGFTLVELLIVIIIIGILAGSMLLVMGAGKDKAEATKIISNLRSLKAASLMCYADNNAWPTTIASLDPYMDGEIDSNDYDVEIVSSDNSVWVKAVGLVANSGINEKLEAMADDVNLKGTAVLTDTFVKGDTDAYVVIDK